jgi:hypothetical protein
MNCFCKGKKKALRLNGTTAEWYKGSKLVAGGSLQDCKTVRQYQCFYYVCKNNRLSMDCRPNCGACCIAISISSPIPGMHGGKPAGLRCVHLLDDFRCALYGDPLRPKVCSDFRAEEEFCGRDREEALRILRLLDDG